MARRVRCAEPGLRTQSYVGRVPHPIVRRAGSAQRTRRGGISIATHTPSMARPPRIKGFDYVGPFRYFLTFCAIDRRATFEDAAAVALVLAQFRRTAHEWSFAILAYCFMPDHVHLLVEGTTAHADLRRVAKRLKQGSGQAWKCRTGSRLWQEGYYDRVLRPEDDAKAVARYILENPVRAGLVAHPSQYPYLGSDVWTLKELLESVMM